MESLPTDVESEPALVPVSEVEFESDPVVSKTESLPGEEAMHLPFMQIWFSPQSLLTLQEDEPSEHELQPLTIMASVMGAIQNMTATV